MKYDAVTKAAIELLAAGVRESETSTRLREAVEAKHPGAIARAKVRREKERFESRFKGSVPDWAKRYVAKYGRGYVLSLTIRQSRTKPYSSGHCWYGEGRLVVTLSKAGDNYGLFEQQATVLHEIAHALARWDQHGDQFYNEWYQMLRDENLYRQVLNSGRFVGVSSLKAAARRARTTKAA